MGSDEEGLNASRRALFRRLGRAVVGPAVKPATPVPHRVFFNADTCTACDLCVKICPSQALNVGHSGENAFYEVHPSLCDGCGICLSVCAADSLTIELSESLEPDRFPVHEVQCAHCGHSFRQNLKAERKSYCPICEKHKHLKGALRVIEG